MADYISMYAGSQMDEADTLSLNPDAVPTEGSGNLVTSDGVARAIEAAETNAENGEKPLLIAGNAEQILSTDTLNDKTPYTFRETADGADVGNLEYDTLIGGTVAWNQLVQNGNFSDTTNWATNNSTLSVSGNIATVTAGTQWGRITSAAISTKAGHKYFVRADVKGTTNNYVDIQITNRYLTVAGQWQKVAFVCVETTDASRNVVIGDKSTGDFAPFNVKNVMCIDLTQMFGSTIADYVSTLESGNAGDGIAWLKSHGFLTEDYYAYDTGSLQSVNAASHITTGKNILNPSLLLAATGWTESDGEYSGAIGNLASLYGVNTDGLPIPRPANTQLAISLEYKNQQSYRAGYIRVDYTDNTYSFIELNSQNWTSASLVTTAGKTIKTVQITLSNSQTLYLRNFQIEYGSAVTAYEPYHADTYPLDSSLTLRGLYKLDGSNNLYADGDEYSADGNVARKWAEYQLDGTEGFTMQGTAGGADQRFGATLASLGFPAGSGVNREYLSSHFMASSNVNNTGVWGNFYVSGTWLVFLDGNGGGSCKFADAAAFNAWLTANKPSICYKVATPTAETATPYASPQSIANGGTEQYTDAGVEAGTRDVAIPAGHDTDYTLDITGAIERVIGQVPPPPTANGTYTLRCVVSGGVATYSWA